MPATHEVHKSQRHSSCIFFFFGKTASIETPDYSIIQEVATQLMVSKSFSGPFTKYKVCYTPSLLHRLMN